MMSVQLVCQWQLTRWTSRVRPLIYQWQLRLRANHSHPHSYQWQSHCLPSHLDLSDLHLHRWQSITLSALCCQPMCQSQWPSRSFLFRLERFARPKIRSQPNMILMSFVQPHCQWRPIRPFANLYLHCFQLQLKRFPVACDQQIDQSQWPALTECLRPLELLWKQLPNPE